MVRGDGGLESDAADLDVPVATDVAMPEGGAESGSPGGFGARCTSDTECLSGTCLSSGHCTRACTTRTDCPESPNWMCVSLPGRGSACDCTATAMTDTPCNNIDDDCNGVVDDRSARCGTTCVDLGSDMMNCGGCGVVCGGGTICVAGTCECPSNRSTVCGTRCVNTMTDPANCGACGTVCPAGGMGTASCAAGRCALTCAAGSADCDGVATNGCETDTRSSLANCGMCGRACSFANATGTCSTGSCVIGACSAGFANCDSDPTNGCETSTATSAMNCGACGRVCSAPNAMSSCAAGACELAACIAGFANCNTVASDGCEVNLQNNINHCGTCGRVCPGATAPNTVAACATGACTLTCTAGFDNCDGNAANGCETDTRSSLTHCGACGTVCPFGQTCASGVCSAITCPAGFGNCDGNVTNGCETDTRSSATNCGTCGTVCPSGQTCSLGACVTTVPVDVMLVFNVSGSSHPAAVNIASTIRSTMVPTLLALGDVRIGVATFADFPVSPWGSGGDRPFQGSIEPVSDLTGVSTALTLGMMQGGDGPESWVESLAVLAGLPISSYSRALICSSGRVGGGCWRPEARRVIVLVNDDPGHNAPISVGGTSLFSPYTGISPTPATWPNVRTALLATNTVVLVLQNGTANVDTTNQHSNMLMDLMQPATDRQFITSASSSIGLAVDAATARIRAIRGM